MISEVIIVTRIEGLELKSSKLVLIGRGVRINEENEAGLFKSFGVGVDALAANGPKTSFQLDETIDNCFIGVGRQSSPETFNVNLSKSSLIFHAQALDGDSPLRHDAAVGVLKTFQAGGGKVICDGLNLLMNGV